MNENNIKKTRIQNRCDRCGNEYPPYQKVKGENKEEKVYYPDCECTVEIKLKKWQIPILLGAIDLGSYAENLCARIIDATNKGEDTLDKDFKVDDDSFQWGQHCLNIMDKIKQQSEINLEYKESAGKGDILEVLRRLVRREIENKILSFKYEGLNRQWLWR